MAPEKKKTRRKQRMAILLAPAAAHKPAGMMIEDHYSKKPSY